MVWNLFVHALSMVFRNIGPALRLSILPFVIGIAAAIGIIVAAGIPGAVFDPGDTGTAGGGESGMLWLAVLLVLALIAVIGLWVAVGWHRYVLLEEQPKGLLPAWHAGRMASYMGRLLLLIVILMVPVLAATVISGVIVGSTGSGGLIVVILFLVAAVLCIYGFYRLCPVLPAAALGETLAFRDAWNATEPGGLGLAFIAVFVGILSFLLNLPGTILGDTLIGQILQLAASWLMFMINLSIMTTIYGHFVEECDLVA